MATSKRSNQWGHLDKRALAAGYRSGLEKRIADQLEEEGIPYEYEAYPLRYIIPERTAEYTADFVLPNGIIIETKGRFTSEDRKKHRLIKQQFPDLDIRILFSNPNNKIGKKSKTTYSMWCDKMGIPWDKAPLPKSWLSEKPDKTRIAAAKQALGWVPPK
jgi:hypothetical protein